MAINFLPSADKHSIPHDETLHAVMQHVNKVAIQGLESDRETMIFVGRPHSQSRDFLEVGVALTHTGDLNIFHSMLLTDKWRYLLYTPECKEWEQ